MITSGWKVKSTKDSNGNIVDDTPVLMKRPDGQPANIQTQYIEYYQKKGFVLIDDPLDIPDVVRAQPYDPPKQKHEIIAEREAAAKKATVDSKVKPQGK